MNFSMLCLTCEESNGARPCLNGTCMKDELALLALHDRPDLMQKKMLAGGGEVVFLRVEHAQKVVDPLVIEIEKLRANPERFALSKLALIGEPILEREHRSRSSSHGLLAQTELFEPAIRRAIERHVVIGDVHVPVVVDPRRLDSTS